jgi:hypothetical protein
MNTASKSAYSPADWNIEPVALRLEDQSKLNRKMTKPGRELRYGTNGSMKIDLVKNVFSDFETNASGGVIDYVMHKLGCNKGQALDWLDREGYLPEDRRGVEPTPIWSAPTGRWDYHDESGNVVHRTVRYDNLKRFSQCRPTGNGGWIWGLDGVQRQLYRLPELIRGVADNKPIFVLEGEKHCDKLYSEGLIATTNPMGAGKWRPEYSDRLRGADVVIIGDNDEPGRNHATVVAEALDGIARRIRVLDLATIWPECPEKGDILNWLDDVGTVDGLTQVVDALPDWHSQPDTEDDLSVEPEWPILDDAALYGLAGEVVSTIGPHTEADPVAILIQYLVAFGNVIGHTAYYLVESDKHHTNIFAVIVGATSKGRKGTSAGRVAAVIEASDPEWFEMRQGSGLSSGEGIIHNVRDQVIKWNTSEQKEEIADQGIKDKRLMITESEFSSALSVTERAGNILSPVIRNAWDGKRLMTMAKHAGQTATGAHISIVGHITDVELKRRLTQTETANGFANRFLFCCAKRSKELPFGGDLRDGELLRLAELTAAAVGFAKMTGRVTMTDGAMLLWKAVYSELSEGKPGLLGALTSRAEAQVIRLALIYTLLDSKDRIDEPHLKAALALWAYCHRSAEYIFGSSLGDPVADEILTALRQRPEGMTKAQIYSELFQCNRSSTQIGAALALLAKAGKAKFEKMSTGGRPKEVWRAT